MIAISNNLEPPLKINTPISPQAPSKKNSSNPTHPTTTLLKCLYPSSSEGKEGL